MTKTSNRARQMYQQHIDNVVSTSYGPQFYITHKCIGEKNQETLKTGIPESLFKEKEPDCLCWARHRELCKDIRGGIASSRKNNAVRTMEQLMCLFSEY
jgi:hypothetical protein